MDMSLHHQFCLKWNNHSSNLLKVFGRLFSNESFTDVTLAAEGRSFRAHKMVLSACSTYFEQLFLEHPEANPIVIMRETSFVDLAVIVEFMYKGEINVSQDQLGSLLKTAESLRVKGLAQATTAGATTTTVPSNGDPNDQGKSPIAGTPPPQSSVLIPAPPPPALLPLFHLNTTAESSSGRESPSNKRRRMTTPKSDQVLDSLSTGVPFAPRIENVVTMGRAEQSSEIPPNKSSSTRSRPESLESGSPTPLDSGVTSAPPPISGAALDLRLTESSSSAAAAVAAAGLASLAGLHNLPIQELTARLELRNDLVSQLQNPGQDSDVLRKVQQEKSEPHCFFRGYPLYKFNDYIAHGTRQQYWEEPFTKAVMEGIQDRELDLKKGAELLGVSYSTLYGRYRECHGYLRHAWTRDYRRSTPAGGSALGGGEWWESDPQDIHRRGGENGGGGPAEELVVEVDSFVEDEDDDLDDEEELQHQQDLSAAVQASKQESLVLSIRHGKVMHNQQQQSSSSRKPGTHRRD